MYGRYGVDELYSFLFKLYLLLLFINIFLKFEVISYIELFLVFYMFFRAFSKNIYKRSDENKLYLKIKNRVLKPFLNIKRNISDKDHIYRKCNKCHTTMKLPLPYERGYKNVKCPKCGNKKRVLVFRKQKIEIIKKKK